MVAAGGELPVTVSVASLLTALPAEFVTTQRKRAPLSEALTDAIEYVEAVAPAIFELFRCHWYASGGAPDAPVD